MPPGRNLPINRFPQHPRGWISSKFYQHSTTRTSLPSKEPEPAILSGVEEKEARAWSSISNAMQLAAAWICYASVLCFLIASPHQESYFFLSFFNSLLSFLLLFLIVVKYTVHQICHLKHCQVCGSIVLSAFTLLCNSHYQPLLFVLRN